MNGGRTIYLDNKRLEALFTGSKNAKAAIIVIHEIWGLSSHIHAVCKQLSELQLAAIAPNLYVHDKSLFTTKNMREAMYQVWDLPLSDRYDLHRLRKLLARKRASPEVFRILTKLYDRKVRARMLAELISWAEYALSKYHKVAAIGFSMGGGLSFKLAARYPPLKSCTSYYGEPPTLQELAKIKAPMLAICAGRDDFMNSRVPEFIHGALKQKKNLILKVYGNAGHEFFNPSERGYDPSAAADSWIMVTNFLRTTLE